MRFLLLPGLDGTGKLFSRFVRKRPPSFSCEVLTYDDGFAEFDEYVNAVKVRLCADTKLAHAPMDIPVLNLRAMQDRLITKAATSSIANIFPHTTSINVNAPHFLLQVCPEECWYHIKKFVANCSA